MKLIVGLGNPGQVYAHNRHNIGFICLKHLARTQGIKLDKKQGKARIGRGEVAGAEAVLARPQTYMNLSGESVVLLVRKFDIKLDDLLVIHDDLDLPLGKIRISRGSGSGGHKGVSSIIYSLGSQDFSRLRVGIGRPVPVGGHSQIGEDDIVRYVLNDFTGEEKRVITPVIPMVSEAALCFLSEGISQAMNRYN
ncbi:MAG: aminoacyl-tRNA hydrolase [Chloroflexi bacterium]|nr:aminoacyl-tRNA hydrolase [Chloroflexota bacterium]